MHRLLRNSSPLLLTFVFVACGSYRTSEIGVCGDGQMDINEICDDGNRDPDDGCSADCRIERGYVCTTIAPAICLLPCAVDPLIFATAGEFEIRARRDCPRALVEVWGAGGGAGASLGHRYGTQGPYVGGFGGGGAFASAILSIPEGAVLNALVGEGGHAGSPGSTCGGGGGGGGASAVFDNGTALLIAGGGGAGAGSHTKLGTTGGIRAAHGSPGKAQGPGPASVGEVGLSGTTSDGPGGTGGFAQSISGGAGGSSPGGGGGGGGHPGGSGGQAGICAATDSEMQLGTAGDGGASLVPLDGFVVPGAGIEPGNKSAAVIAGVGGTAPEVRAAGQPGTDGRIMVRFMQ